MTGESRTQDNVNKSWIPGLFWTFQDGWSLYMAMPGGPSKKPQRMSHFVDGWIKQGVRK